MPPNGQGIAALETLNILALEDAQAMGFQSPDLLHLQIEAFKLAFHDRNRYVTDPEFEEIPVEGLLSESYARSQRSRISMERANQKPTHGEPRMSDTVYLCAADSDGNMVSFINSLYMGWGSGITAGRQAFCFKTAAPASPWILPMSTASRRENGRGIRSSPSC